MIEPQLIASNGTKPRTLDDLRLELAVKAKSGVNFILAASVVWSIIVFVWTLSYSAYDRSVLTLLTGGLFLPLALAFSKLLRTSWKIPGNPIAPLGLWLNFAQLCYFPFLVFVLLEHPADFVMTFGIITGGHFLPYGWFYREASYVGAGIAIPIGTLLLGLTLPPGSVHWIPAFVAAALLALSGALCRSYRTKRVAWEAREAP